MAASPSRCSSTGRCRQVAGGQADDSGSSTVGLVTLALPPVDALSLLRTAPQIVALLPMTVRFSNSIQCGGSWSFVRYRGFFT